jgi:hypothetical protein
VLIVELDVFWSTKPKKPKAEPDPSEPSARPPEVSYSCRKPPELLEPGSEPYHFEVEVVQTLDPVVGLCGSIYQPCTPEEPVMSSETSFMVLTFKDCVSVPAVVERMTVPVIDWKFCS